MPSSPLNIELTSRDDFSDLKTHFSQSGRLQIRNFLDVNDAKALRAEVIKLSWRLVLNENGKHLDIHPRQLEQIPTAKLREIKQAAQSRASHEFQYLFENYPVFDMLESGKTIPPAILAIHAVLNTPEVLKQLSDLTALPIDFCDMQATRYRAGHFLTTHDDGIEGKNRQLAYVLNLSERWRESWGGCLNFTNSSGEVEQSLLPVFNSLSLFKVPQPHEVTRVKPTAKSSRLSLTGWFRTRA